MELYERILCETIAHEIIPSLQLDAASLVEMKCYNAIQKIYEILSDDAKTDEECFLKIEQIVGELDALGIGGGGRHDF